MNLRSVYSQWTSAGHTCAPRRFPGLKNEPASAGQWRCERGARYGGMTVTSFSILFEVQNSGYDVFADRTRP
jgi:hypothetical protein